MNRKRAGILIGVSIGLASTMLATLFPPWRFTIEGASRELDQTGPRALLWSPPTARESDLFCRTRIDYNRLGADLILGWSIAGLIGLAVVFVRPGAPRSRDG